MKSKAAGVEPEDNARGRTKRIIFQSEHRNEQHMHY